MIVLGCINLPIQLCFVLKDGQTLILYSGESLLAASASWRSPSPYGAQGAGDRGKVEPWLVCWLVLAGVWLLTQSH